MSFIHSSFMLDPHIYIFLKNKGKLRSLRHQSFQKADHCKSHVNGPFSKFFSCEKADEALWTNYRKSKVTQPTNGKIHFYEKDKFICYSDWSGISKVWSMICHHLQGEWYICIWRYSHFELVIIVRFENLKYFNEARTLCLRSCEYLSSLYVRKTKLLSNA